MRQERSIRLRLAGNATLRTMKFEDRDHLVVPTVMLVEGVLQAVNAPAPEFVPAEVFSAVPQGWDGRPAVGGHPNDGNRQVSANTPKVLEQNKIGILFHTSVQNKKLVTEAWIDPSLCKPGTIGERVLARLRAGETVEVSVGVYVALEKRKGDFNGQKFEAVWTDMVPDHLAFLPEGQEGACNEEDGCGAPRAARAYQLTAAGAFEEVSMEPKTKWQALRERIAAGIMRIRGAEQSMSDQDLRDKLHTALFAEEAGFLGIDAVFPSDNKVVYATQPEAELKLWRRSFSNEDGTVTLAGDKEEVQLETSYVPVTAAEAASCPCGAKKPTDASSHEQEGGRQMAQKTKAERIKALIESTTLPWAESDRAFLESLPEDRLATFEAPLPANSGTVGETTGTQANPPASPAPVAAPSATPASSPEPVTAEAYVAAAPPEVRDFLQSGLRAAQAQKSATITALKATNRCGFSDTELNAMSQEGLNRLLALAGTAAPAVDFAGRGGVSRDATQATDEEKVPPPPSLTNQIRAARGMKVN